MNTNLVDQTESRGIIYNNSDNRLVRCIARRGTGWIGGRYNLNQGQFSDGRNVAQGMNSTALSGTYTETFKTKREAIAWLWA
jgi:hypothetical protein